MKKTIIIILLLGFLFSGCSGSNRSGVRRSGGVTKAESRMIAMQYMAGTQPCGFVNLIDSYGWDFRVKREGVVSIVTIFVDKKTGMVLGE